MESKISAHCTLSAVVTRADGTVEDLGVICEGESAPQEKKTFIEKLRGILKNG